MVVPEGNLPAAAVRCGVVAECQNQKHSSTAPMLLRLLRRLLRRLLLVLPLPHAPAPRRPPQARTTRGHRESRIRTDKHQDKHDDKQNAAGPRERGQRAAKRRIMTS